MFPRVVWVAMRHGHQFDVRRLNVYLFELRRERDWFAPDRAGAGSPFMKHPVSYTHLDVYKRQDYYQTS